MHLHTLTLFTFIIYLGNLFHFCMAASCCMVKRNCTLLNQPLLMDVGEGNGNPLQYPCLENPMDGDTW